ncbi:hypothetical protein FJZ36_00835 [Candidatus Poribacteria bacterium]|nr:hypothetical protein [Candidatus Poribacteria bacterium]
MARRTRARTPVFQNYGGHYHLVVERAEDLAAVVALDDGRWVATSCPVTGLEADPAFLAFLDADGNGRIVSDDVRAAIQWTTDALHPSSSWLDRTPAVPIDLIRTDTATGAALLASAKRVLSNLGSADQADIHLDQVRDRRRIMSEAVFNGDGVIPPSFVADPDAAALARDLIACLGGAEDVSGAQGVDDATLDRFRQEATAFLAWHDQGTADSGPNQVMPFGDATPAAAAAVASIRAKAEEFFAQCALVRFDPRALDRLTPPLDGPDPLDVSDPEAIRAHLRRAPLAAPDASGVLPLIDGFNESYRSELSALRDNALLPALGEPPETLDEPTWRSLLSRLAPYGAWTASKPSTPVEGLGVDRLRELLASPHDAELRRMILADREVGDELRQVRELERLVLYHRWLATFVNNFVSFPDLFAPHARAMFEVGTLVIDGREMAFSVLVSNRAVHAALAKNSGMFLLYLQITGSQPPDSREVVVPVTRGSTANLYVGRRGVFFDRTGRELDAQITQVVEGPVSLWESMKEPIRRARALVAGRTEQLAASVQKEAETHLTTATTSVESRVQTGIRTAPSAAAVSQTAELPAAPQPPPLDSASPTPPPPASGKGSGTARDLMIGAGFVVAGLGTALKLITDTATKLAEPGAVQRLLATASATFGVLFTVVMFVTAVTAWLRLRRRDLGILLQACGWALNGRVLVRRRMARLFTRVTRLPSGSRRRRKDLVGPLAKIARQAAWQRWTSG